MTQITALYNPLDWQIAPWRDKSPIMLLTGAAGGGKSRCAAEKVNAFMKYYPNATGLMLRKAREFCNKSIVPFMRRTVVGEDGHVQFKKSDFCFEYENGSTLFFGGMKDEGQREAIRSIGQDGSLDIVWIEEANAFSLADFEEILARMRGKAAPWTQIILTTNPDSPYHWINTELITGGGASVYYSDWSQNPHNPSEYGNTLNRLSGVRRLRLRDGKWVQAEGVVYADYDPATHVIEPFDIPDDWRCIRVIDFGYTNPFVCQWWAIDGDGRMYLYREIYMSGRTVKVHSEQINKLSEGERIEATVCDHDAEDRATLRENNIYNIAAVKDVSPGIQAVEERLKLQGDGKPRLYVFKGCRVEMDQSLRDGETFKPTCTEEEFPGYIWPKHKPDREEKEAPSKLNDHGMDALRYGVMYLDTGSTPAGETVTPDIDIYKSERQRTRLWRR